MKALDVRTLLLALGLALASAAAADSPRDSRVEIDWTPPADFSEAKTYQGTGLGRQNPDEWLGDLAHHLRYRPSASCPKPTISR
jgi:hypothetical protein